MTLLDTALSAGMKADYVLFDSWFSNPAQITAIHSKGMDVIDMITTLSDEFGVEIPDEEIENFHTVGDVVAYVEEHMQ